MKRIVAIGMMLAGLLMAQPPEGASGPEAEFQRLKKEIDQIVARIDRESACSIQRTLNAQLLKFRETGKGRKDAFNKFYGADLNYYQDNVDRYTQELRDIAAEKARLVEEIKEIEDSLKVLKKREADLRDNTVLSQLDKEDQSKRLERLEKVANDQLDHAKAVQKANEEREVIVQAFLEKNRNQKADIEAFDRFKKSETDSWANVYKSYQQKVTNDCPPPKVDFPNTPKKP